MSKQLQIRNITPQNFKKYGVVCEHIKKKDLYEPLVTVQSRGWIWAILTFDWKNIKDVQCHPTSKESFEPVFGTTVILLAPPKHPKKLEAFLLDKAVMLHEGVWHQVMALSDRARVKITENNDVTSETIRFKRPFNVVLQA
jgi:ureidoglycolate hydrolase